jgi:hypothetical protein
MNGTCASTMGFGDFPHNGKAEASPLGAACHEWLK